MYLSLAYCAKQKDILSIKIFIYSVLLFHLRAIFSEPAWLFFTTWQAIPFKRKFYLTFHLAAHSKLWQLLLQGAELRYIFCGY